MRTSIAARSWPSAIAPLLVLCVISLGKQNSDNNKNSGTSRKARNSAHGWIPGRKHASMRRHYISRLQAVGKSLCNCTTAHMPLLRAGRSMLALRQKIRLVCTQQEQVDTLTTVLIILVSYISSFLHHRPFAVIPSFLTTSPSHLLCSRRPCPIVRSEA